MLGHAVMGTGIVYGIFGFYFAERLESRLLEEFQWRKGFWTLRIVHAMCILAWPVVVFEILTEGEKRP